MGREKEEIEEKRSLGREDEWEWMGEGDKEGY